MERILSEITSLKYTALAEFTKEHVTHMYTMTIDTGAKYATHRQYIIALQESPVLQKGKNKFWRVQGSVEP